MSEPSYWDDKIYLIRGDALELKRHILALADDLTFCTEHSALRALEQFDEKARKIYAGADRAGKASMNKLARHVRLHPALAVLAGCALGAVLGALAFHSSRPDATKL